MILLFWQIEIIKTHLLSKFQPVWTQNTDFLNEQSKTIEKTIEYLFLSVKSVFLSICGSNKGRSYALMPSIEQKSKSTEKVKNKDFSFVL